MADPSMTRRVERLLQVAHKAEALEQDLDRARRRYEATHDPAILVELRYLSQAALETEVHFATLWGGLRKAWSVAAPEEADDPARRRPRHTR